METSEKYRHLGAQWHGFRREHPEVAAIVREIDPGLANDAESTVHPGDIEEIDRMIDNPWMYNPL